MDLTSKTVNACIGRLKRQPGIYQRADSLTRKKMQVRALMFCALTLKATAIWTAKLLFRGRCSMRTQRLFFLKRWRKEPKEWGESAKSCFARALSGYSIGKDGSCIDRHLQRTGCDPVDAEAQWREWFRLYESMYGPGETIACVSWHIRILDWIALSAPKPAPWK